MGLYSRIHAVVATCAACGYKDERVFQFKFADKRLRDYRVGDPLLWEANVEGEPGHMRVITSAFAEACPQCGAEDNRLYQVVIEQDHITALVNVGDEVNELAVFGPDGYRYEDY
ncbi:MAG TPA: hypothetical protein VND96_02955 [Candidatus Micrarchaeaceae archaeon]|nr:hypothetical protein [Candidatus Micrarchaeaceae archaeon]